MPSSSSSLGTEVEEKLMEYGTKLLDPPAAVDELLKLLEIIEQLLIMVDQAPSRSMQDALLPCMMGLIAADILRHPDMDVKVSVAFCMCEITRITAPDPPYDEEQMKEIFQLTLATLNNLPHASDRCYKKAVSILDTVSRVKSCLMMLDLELEDLIIQMFKQFLEVIGSSHSSTVFSAMETIMIDVIDESDDISLGLLTPLLESVKKEKQDVSPYSWKLGEKVITSCAAKLKPYLMEAVKFTGTALDDYAQIVAITWENRLDALKQNSVHNSEEHSLEPEQGNLCPRDGVQSSHGASKLFISPDEAVLDCSTTRVNENSLKEVENRSMEHLKASEAKGSVENMSVKPREGMKLEIVPESVTKKRGRKPNSWRNSEEGYNHSSIVAENKNDKIPHKRKSLEIESSNLVIGLPALPSKRTKMTNNLEYPSENAEKEETSISLNQPVSSGSQQKRGRPKRSESMICKDDPNAVSSSGEDAMNANVKEEVIDASDVGLEKEVKDTSDSKEKPRRYIKKIGHSSKTGKEAITRGDLASEKGADGSSGPQKKLPHKLLLNDTENTGAINSTEGHTEIFCSQTLKGTKTRKSTPKRKCSGGGKEKAYEMDDLDERLVGKKIKVWWPMDKTFYEGVIESYDSKKKRHKILYTDDEVEILNLCKKRWQLIPDSVSPDRERNNVEIASPSPVSPASVPKRRRKSKLADEEKVASSSRRNEVSRGMEVEAKNSVDKTLAESRIDHPNVDGAEVGTSGDREKLKDDDTYSAQSERMKDGDFKSGEGEKLQDDGVKSEGGLQSKDDGANFDCVKSREGEKLKDDDANSGQCKEREDDGVNSMDQFNEEELINSTNKSNVTKLSTSGEEKSSNPSVKLNEGKSIGSVNKLNEETSGIVEKNTSWTETTSDVGAKGDVTEKGEGKSDEEKLSIPS